MVAFSEDTVEQSNCHISDCKLMRLVEFFFNESLSVYWL